PWSDLYSLGCVAYELVCGDKLFEGSDLVEIYQEHFRPRHPRLSSVIDLPEGFQQWLDRMTAREVDDRFQTAADAARALADLDDSEISVSAPPDASERRFSEVAPVLEPILEDSASLVSTEEDEHVGPHLRRLPRRWPSPTLGAHSIQIVGTGLGLYGLRSIPLVGRDRELDKMWRTFRTVARDEQDHILVVRGSQGCGKTRLVEWFTQRLEEFGAAAVLKATHSVTSGSSEGFSSMLERHFRTMGASDREAERTIRREMGEEGFDTPYEWHVMTQIMRPVLDDEADSSALRIARPSQRYAVLRRYLRKLAADKPVILWCDDVHWASDTLAFANFLRRVHSDEIGAVFTILVATEEVLVERSSERELLEELLECERVDEIALEPLDPRHHEKLVQELLLLEGDLSREVAHRTAGNPLFAVELIGDWVERGVLEVGQEGFVLSEGVDPVIPDHLHDVWVHRLEGLLAGFSFHAREALELAAALGQTVRMREWKGLCDLAGVRLDENLASELIARRFAQKTEEGWSFAHSIVRESLERQAREEGRWVDHRRLCATLMETLYDTSQPRIAERYGRYAKSAHQFERALAPLLLSVDGRRKEGDYRRAQQLVTAYLECLEGMAASDDDSRWCEGWLQRAHTHLSVREPREAHRWAQKAEKLAEIHGWDELHAQSLACLGLAKQWTGQKDAPEHLHRAYEAINRIEITDDNHWVFDMTAHGLTRLGEFDNARRLVKRQLELAHRLDDDQLVARCYHLRCRIAFFEEDFEEALHWIDESVTICEVIDHKVGKGNCLELEAEIYRRRGELERAEDLYRRCIGLHETIGYSTAIAETNLANILLKQGRPSEAEERFLRARRAFDRSGRRMFEAVARAGLLACAAARHFWGNIDEHLEPIQTFLTETNACETDLAELLEYAGDCMREMGQFRDSVGVYTLAVQQWQRLGDNERVDECMQKISRWR
ncbi:MAG: AAA family ATPase, partial [Persicimonas sp.]